MMKASSWRGHNTSPIATHALKPLLARHPESKTDRRRRTFVLKMEEENAGSGRRSRRPTDPKSPRSNL